MSTKTKCAIGAVVKISLCGGFYFFCVGLLAGQVSNCWLERSSYHSLQQFALRKFKLAAIDYYPRNIRKFLFVGELYAKKLKLVMLFFHMY